MGECPPWKAQALDLGGCLISMPAHAKYAQAKVHRSYTVDEVAALYECHRNTVTAWVSEGLRPIDDHYPIMFHGTVLNDFRRRRRSALKRPCGPGEIYCVVCRCPQTPAGGMADYVRGEGSVGTITAICPGCGRLLRQAVGPERLVLFMERCSVSLRTLSNVLGEPPLPADTVHSGTGVSK
jgi:hypothetical protein